MKYLTLIRHAKSSWEHEVDDFYRPLKNSGINDALLTSSELGRNFTPPDMVFSSPAERAISTCNIFVKNLRIDKSKVKTVLDLYDFGGEKVTNFIKEINNTLDNVMLFGHNHAFTEISNQLSNLKIDNLPTSGIVVMQFDISDWKDIGNGKVISVLYPKLFK